MWRWKLYWGFGWSLGLFFYWDFFYFVGNILFSLGLGVDYLLDFFFGFLRFGFVEGEVGWFVVVGLV